MSDKPYVLKGKALLLKERVYRGERKTIKEWHEELYPDSKSETPSAIYFLMRCTLRAGFPLVPVAINPNLPRETGYLVPLTEKPKYMIATNRRVKGQILGRSRTLSSFMLLEMQASHRMGEYLEADINEFLAQYMTMRKIIQRK